jgi:glycosyltransferase involved in cell wall biosynthesis
VAAPLVTVAISLYRSRPFVDRIARNIESLDYPSVEILISDRHMDDDAIELLGARFAGDPRIRFLRANDGIGWVEHYNLLLRAATGSYVLWMPHDDEYSPGYIAALVECLERFPDTVLAFGGVEVEDETGTAVWREGAHAPAIPVDGPWGPGAALGMMMLGGRWLPHFHGLFRRAPVVEAGLFVRPTADNVEADVYWVFGIGLLGRIRFVSGCSYRKHLHGANVSLGWGRRRLRHVRDSVTVPWGYIRDLARDNRDVLRAIPLLFAWMALRATGSLTHSWRWPSTKERAWAKGLLQRVLTPRANR